MKHAILFALLALPVSAQITATFEIVETTTGTPLGNVVVELQYDKTPQTVANFITLAEGTRSSYDPATGAVRPKKFYAGESFYRVVDNTGFKIAQTGSGNGSNSGGPGYKFRDEILLPTLKHDPYMLAMANAGPNTNGSQIYFTGSAAIPSLDGKHTVFGRITEPSSRTVIDQIIIAGNNGTSITDVTIQRDGAEAEAFDEFAWNLPTCSGVPGDLSVQDSGGGPSVVYTPESALTINSQLRVSKSLNLSSWNYFGQLPVGYGWPAGQGLILENAIQPKVFYNISLTTFPNPILTNSLHGRTMDLEGLQQPGAATCTLVFNETESGGNLTLSTNPTQNYAFTIDNNAEAYGSILVLYPVQAWPYNRPVYIVCGYDTESSAQIDGRHSTSLATIFNGQIIDLEPIGSGPLTLSK